MAIAVAALVFFGVLVALTLWWAGTFSRRAAASLELARRLGPGELPVQLLRQRELDPVGRLLGSVGMWVHDLSVRAGSNQTVGSVVLWSIVWAAAGTLLMAGLIGPLLAPFGLVLGAGPVLLLIQRAHARSRKITEQLPDALDLMARALRSGHAFTEALRMSAVELPAPISEELAPTAEEHRLGLDLRLCLEDLLRRVPDSFELRLFVSAVLLHRDTGGNLIEILDQLAETVRERLVFEAKVHAMTAEVRTSARILEALPFAAAFLLTIVAPDYLGPLFSPGLGRAMVVYAGISMITGMLIMRRIAQVGL